VVCYTNHALDQFLTAMLRKGQRRLVRVGGMSKDASMAQYTLFSLARHAQHLGAARARIFQVHQERESVAADMVRTSG